MTPAGQNYPIHEHSFLFWGLYLGGVIAFTFLALCLFVVMVHRTSQATRPATRPATPDAHRSPQPSPSSGTIEAPDAGAHHPLSAA